MEAKRAHTVSRSYMSSSSVWRGEKSAWDNREHERTQFAAGAAEKSIVGCSRRNAGATGTAGEGRKRTRRERRAAGRERHGNTADGPGECGGYGGRWAENAATAQEPLQQQRRLGERAVATWGARTGERSLAPLERNGHDGHRAAEAGIGDKWRKQRLLNLALYVLQYRYSQFVISRTSRRSMCTVTSPFVSLSWNRCAFKLL